MIAIITEKPSVGMEIARVAGATEKHDGYICGNGYMVTWALGHLVSLAPPGYYGPARPSAQDLPIIPDPFQLVVRQQKTARGMVSGKAASKQLNAIDHVFSQCDSIIVATDADRAGELMFRYIYDYLGYTKPFKRLWISSLTDEAIIKGLANPRESCHYDHLYMAADCRAKADWLVKANGSAALAIASGTGYNSLGRVQTPVLAMICARYKENRNFMPSAYWVLHTALLKDGESRLFRYTGEIKGKTEAETLFSLLKTDNGAKITKVEKKKECQGQPLLYNLAGLQKDCNTHLGLSAEKTSEIVQSLYEKKLISFPKTASRHIPEDMFREIPPLLGMVSGMDRFRHFADVIMGQAPARGPVNDGKITGHYALIVTGNDPGGLPLTYLESEIYHMVAGRMLEAFGPECVKESLLVEALVGGYLFRSRSLEIISHGWRGVFNHPGDMEEDEKYTGGGMPAFEEGENVKAGGYSLGQKKTKPKPLYTEASLLDAMETCGGGEVSGGAPREAPDGYCLGTPSTRPAIISTLFKRDYVRLSGKSLVPTEKGLSIYEAVKHLGVADVEMNASWEKALSDIENKTMAPGTFMDAFKVHTRQVVKGILSMELPQMVESGIACPKCGTGKIAIRHKLALCGNMECGLLVFRKFLNKELTDQHLRQLFTCGSTKTIKGIKGKKGAIFNAKLVFDKNYNISLPANKKGGAKPQKGSKQKKQG